MAISPRRVALACVLIAFAAAPRPADVAWAEKRSLEDLRRVLDQQQKDAAERKAREESLRNQAESLKAEVADLRARMIETAGRIQDQESDASRLEKRLSNLEARERALRERLKANENSAAKTLGGLERLALSPPAAILARPAESAVQTVRTAILLRALVPNIELEAAALRQQIAALHAVRSQIDGERAALAKANTDLFQERAKLTKLADAKQRQEASMRAQAENEAAQAQKIAAKANDLKGLVRSLEREESARQAAAARAALAARAQSRRPPRTPPAEQSAAAGDFAALKGQVRLPVRGEIVRRYGQTDAFGNRARGLTVETRPGATVVAPVSGKIVFAGPFRGYGQLLIISPAPGYHVLLAGMSRIDAAVGQFLLAGEPVGQMTLATDVAQDEGAGRASVRSASNQPRLYMEFRRNGDPIDPAPWFASLERKGGE